MSRDTDKDYVVTGPYVTMRTLTTEGPRIMGYGPGAPVPLDLPEKQFEHLLRKGLIAPQGEEPQSDAGVVQPVQRQRQAIDAVGVARVRLAEAQAVLDNALAAKAEADAAVDADRKGAPAAKADAKPDGKDDAKPDGKDDGQDDGGGKAPAGRGTAAKVPAGKAG